jgi:hypothetical protein
MFQRSIFKIFISTHSLIKHIQCIKRQYIIHSKTRTSLVQGKFCSLEKYDILCLSRKSLIGSQPNSKKRAALGMVIFVLKIYLAALYCHVSSIPLGDKADGIHTAHPSINV